MPTKKRTGDILDKKAFEKMKRIMPSQLESHKYKDDNCLHVRDMPEEISFKLTNRCNLRCEHCYQWSEAGHHHNMIKAEQKEELDFSLFEKVFLETDTIQSNLVLWGGEPLLYKHWDELVELLSQNCRWTSVCTNGVMLEKRMESILNISERLELLIAVDGFREEHNEIRNNSYDAVIRNINLLLKERELGNYKGEISINFVITTSMANKIYSFVEFFEKLGVDYILISLPWFVNDNVSLIMDEYFKRNFSWLDSGMKKGTASWHSYKYRIELDVLDVLKKQLKKVEERKWDIKVRYNPKLDLDELYQFITGMNTPPKKISTCLSIRNRMDVMPNGDVVSCKLFPEFKLGNLNNKSAREIWHFDSFNKLREIVNQKLMPICSSCNVLYKRGM